MGTIPKISDQQESPPARTYLGRVMGYLPWLGEYLSWLGGIPILAGGATLAGGTHLGWGGYPPWPGWGTP